VGVTSGRDEAESRSLRCRAGVGETRCDARFRAVIGVRGLCRVESW
jgi:hypothetical protein